MHEISININIQSMISSLQTQHQKLTKSEQENLLEYSTEVNNDGIYTRHIHLSIIRLFDLTQFFIIKQLQKKFMKMSHSHNIFLIVFVYLPLLACSITFNPILQGERKLCFHQLLQSGHRYELSVFSSEDNPFTINVGHKVDYKFVDLYNRSIESIPKSSDQTDIKSIIRINKLATFNGDYYFCITNDHYQDAIFNITFNAGEGMLQLTELPNNLDSYKLDDSIEQLKVEISKIRDRSESMQSIRDINVEINSLASYKMLIFGTIGLLIIGIVNFMFYKNMKKELRNRKLI